MSYGYFRSSSAAALVRAKVTAKRVPCTLKMPLDFLISALVTLLVVVDPIGLVPSYLAITQGLPQSARRSVAFRATLIAAAILAGSALIGDWLLHTLSIGLPAFRIAGGLL